MRKILFIMSILALAACGNDDDAVATPPAEPTPAPRLLTVEVNENPMQDENTSAREMTTRTAAATTTATLSSFTMNCQVGESSWNKTFTKTDNTWSTFTWPDVGNDTKLDFYAHSDGTFNWNSGNPYVSFTMNEDAFNQKDFLVAKHASISYNKAKAVGKAKTGLNDVAIVSQTFDHACAAVQFYVYKEENANYIVKSIKLKGMKNQAKYYYNTGWGDLGYSALWDSDESKRIYTLTNGDINVSTDKQLLPCKWLFIIPQSKDGITIDVTYTKGSGDSKTKNLKLSSGSWEAGTQYTVDIKIGK